MSILMIVSLFFKGFICMCLLNFAVKTYCDHFSVSALNSNQSKTFEVAWNLSRP